MNLMYLQALDICDRNNGTKLQTILRAGGLSIFGRLIKQQPGTPKENLGVPGID